VKDRQSFLLNDRQCINVRQHIFRMHFHPVYHIDSMNIDINMWDSVIIDMFFHVNMDILISICWTMFIYNRPQILYNKQQSSYIIDNKFC
jgi:hypothetical protein